MTGKVFVDTNVLIYAHDLDAGSKHTIATAILKDLRHRLSSWDALIVTAALAGHAAKILSEGLQSGKMIEGILIENPFAVSPVSEPSALP